MLQLEGLNLRERIVEYIPFFVLIPILIHVFVVFLCFLWGQIKVFKSFLLRNRSQKSPFVEKSFGLKISIYNKENQTFFDGIALLKLRCRRGAMRTGIYPVEAPLCPKPAATRRLGRVRADTVRQGNGKNKRTTAIARYFDEGASRSGGPLPFPIVVDSGVEPLSPGRELFARRAQRRRGAPRAGAAGRSRLRLAPRKSVERRSVECARCRIFSSVRAWSGRNFRHGGLAEAMPAGGQ